MPGAIPGVMLFVLLLFPLSACAGKNTVVLETEELVDAGMESQGREEGTPKGRQTQKKQVTPEGQDSPAGQEISPGQETAGAAPVAGLLYVHICGAVREPGVYGLPEGSRVYEAVREAGGFAETADENYVNLSLTLEDGWKIVIPTLKETERERTAAASAADEGRNTQDKSGIGSDFSGITPKDGTAGGMRGGSPADEGTGLVDLNGASEAELCTLPGIGESRARSIIAYRERNGGFSRIEDIMKIEGIKEGMFSKLKDRICVR